MSKPRRARAQSNTPELRDTRTLGRAGVLAALAPLVVPALLEIHANMLARSGWTLIPELLAIAVILGVLVLDGALTFVRTPRFGRPLLLLGVLATAGLVIVDLRDQPAPALLLLVGGFLLLTWIFAAPEADDTIRVRPVASKIATARAAAFGTLAAALAMIGFRLTDAPFAVGYPIVSLLVTVGLTLRAIGKPKLRTNDVVLGVTALASLAGALALWNSPDLAMLPVCGLPIALLITLRRREHAVDPLHGQGWRELMLEQPARMLVSTFLVSGMAGGVILTLPICSTGPEVSLIDGMFTSFSAICVTGLTVLDTATVYSRVGQGVIMAIIQLGGLGIMSFSTAAMVLLGRRMSMRGERAAVELIGGQSRADLTAALRRMLLVTGVTELLGAIGLTGLFLREGDSIALAIWRGSFTSVSAFCNAGFGIQSDNLVTYQANPGVLHIVALLIIFGGLGPAVVVGFPAGLRRGRFNLHAQIVLLTTAILLIVPTFMIAALEWNTTLAGMSLVDRLSNAWFQSVTTRTAGFNSVDFAAMNPATLVLVDALMFIGGSPGSTAGGIKTTTLFVLIAAVFAVTRQRDAVIWGGWRLPPSTLYRAAAVVTLGALSVLLSTFLLLLTQGMDLQVALFECVSALGTVGLTIGGTAQLDSIGKLIIITCMFMGRVAPLTLFLMFNRPVADETWEYPEQDVSVG
ncbi:TrkH family potassium uptake protein [Nannocystaceae bacterium ST9]